MATCDNTPYAIALLAAQVSAAVLGIGIIFVTVVEYKRNIASQKPLLVGLVLASHVSVLMFLFSSIFADVLVPTCTLRSLFFIVANDLNPVFAEFAVLFNTLASIQRFSTFTSFLQLSGVVLVVLRTISICVSMVTLAAYAYLQLTGIDAYTYCTIISMTWMLTVELILTFKMMNAISLITTGVKSGVMQGTARASVRNHPSVLTRNNEHETVKPSLVSPVVAIVRAKEVAATTRQVRACFATVFVTDVIGIAFFAWLQIITDINLYIIISGIVTLIVGIHVTMSSIFLRFYHQVYYQQG